MTEFLLAALTFPAIVFTTLLGISLGYWSLVIVGMFGPESLEGAVDGVLGGAAEGTAALTAPDDDDEPAPGSLALRERNRGFLAKYELRRVPVTVSFSLFTLFGWTLTHVTSLMGGAALDGLIARPIWGSVVMLLAVFISLRLTSWAIVPLAPFFSGSQSITNDQLIGEIARVQTIRVTHKVGQATVVTSGGSLNITIRADESLGLTKHDRVMLVSYDPEHQSFEVSRIDDMLPSEATSDANR
jgi:hypothetical protein